MKDNDEVNKLFNKWLDRTVELHKSELGKLGVGETDALKRSVRKHLRRLGDGYIEGGLVFLKRGRFIDMGSGRGYSFGKSTRGSFEMDKARKSKRKRKPWYGKVFYARLNDLQGAVGFKLMEQAVEVAKFELLKK